LDEANPVNPTFVAKRGVLLGEDEGIPASVRSRQRTSSSSLPGRRRLLSRQSLEQGASNAAFLEGKYRNARIPFSLSFVKRVSGW
jgi:hypothetical protein